MASASPWNISVPYRSTDYLLAASSDLSLPSPVHWKAAEDTPSIWVCRTWQCCSWLLVSVLPRSGCCIHCGGAGRVGLGKAVDGRPLSLQLSDSTFKMFVAQCKVLSWSSWLAGQLATQLSQDYILLGVRLSEKN